MVQNSLYLPGFDLFIEIDGQKFCRAEYHRHNMKEAGLCYFLEVSLAYLAEHAPIFPFFQMKKLVKEDIPLEHVKIPFVAMLSHSWPHYQDWAAYFGWPFWYFVTEERQNECLGYLRWTPNKVASNGDKCSEQLARKLFPFLDEYLYRQ